MGYRGYIFSREFMGERVPQHVQNLVIRDYCAKKNMHYMLSATEYAMKNCFLILNQIIEEISQLDGIVCYSLFQIPSSAAERHNIFERIIYAGKSIHFALEGMSVVDNDSYSRVEDIWRVRTILPNCFLSKEVV